ncbi:hypothetical protein OSB04_010597 [Centaurea solstitialis]|uniref:Uncharacterized protein n=1 Tax=Centaurea solstitialis TaxID=347529 RepID=A0AA38TSP3_9ASTR|nr:hypothetical protein OSB04_010597 [Centaurea solstitialis]
MLLARMVQGFTWELPPNEPHVDLKENLQDLMKAKPLFALVKPRKEDLKKDNRQIEKMRCMTIVDGIYVKVIFFLVVEQKDI